MSAVDSISILIADDHPMVRSGLRSMLNAPGFRILGEARTGQEAIDMATKMHPDVILMDIRMPHMDGIVALETIRKARLRSRVIMMTSYQSTSYLLRALALGASGYILKSIPQQDLLSTIKDVAAGTNRVDHRFLQNVLRELNKTSPPSAEIVSDIIEPLTDREMDVLRLLVEGLTNQAIANMLDLRISTVKSHVETILGKLNVSDRTQAAVKAIRVGIVK